MHSLRSATGVLVLSTALLIGSAGGAIASADTSSSDAASTSSPSGGESNSDDENSSSSPLSPTESGSTSDESDATQSAADDSTQSAADVDDAAPAGIDGSLAADEESEAAADADALADSAVVDSENSDSESGALPSGAGPTVAEPVSRPSSGRDNGIVAAFTAQQTAKSDSSIPSAVAATSRSGSAVSDMRDGTPKADLVTESTSPTLPVYQPLATMVANVQTAVISLGSAAAAIPPALWALTYSQTPFSDAVALLESVLHSVTQSATAFAQLPSNLVALLGVPTVGADAILAGIANPSSDHRLVPVMDARPAAVIPALAPLFLQQTAPVQQVGGVAGQPAFAPGTPNALAALAAPTQVAPTSIPALAGHYDSLFDRAFGAMLVPLSLWALATGALPGLVGLLVIFGAGARVGYRQAKAGFALRVAGIARFAGSGPLGVVRSGTFIAIPQRGLRSAGTGIARLSLLGDQAA